MSFETLGLSEPIIRAIQEHGDGEPTSIQTQTIPIVLSGDDLLASLPADSEQTTSFTLPLLQRLLKRRRTVRAQKTLDTDPPIAAPARLRKRVIRALVLVPTPELAAHIEQSVRAYGVHSKLVPAVLAEGADLSEESKSLTRSIDILIATPQRLLEHHEQDALDLSLIETLVLATTERLLDASGDALQRVLALLPEERQNLLFCGVLSAAIEALAGQILDHPQRIELAPVELAPTPAAAAAITQTAIQVERAHKRALLAYLIAKNNWRQVLVFTRTKHEANRIVVQLESDSISAIAIHDDGDKNPRIHSRVLAAFKDGSVQVLVATDLSARGIDINPLPHVIHFDLPVVADDYMQRIECMHRGGGNGSAISFVSTEEEGFLASIERLIERKLPRETVPDFKDDLDSQASVLRQAVLERKPQRVRLSLPPGAQAPASHRAVLKPKPVITKVEEPEEPDFEERQPESNANRPVSHFFSDLKGQFKRGEPEGYPRQFRPNNTPPKPQGTQNQGTQNQGAQGKPGPNSPQPKNKSTNSFGLTRKRRKPGNNRPGLYRVGTRSR